MRIAIVTPAPPGSHRGNRVTAERWADILRGLGHSVDLIEDYHDQDCDVLVVLHAGRGAESVRRFRAAFPHHSLVVAVAGTDIYGDQFDLGVVRQSLAAADRVVVLQPRTAGDLPNQFHPKVRVIYQSARPPITREAPRAGVFEVAVVGHLRPVKDPFRAAEAAALLERTSRIKVLHLGEALSPDMAERARQEEAQNPRYKWLGDLPHATAMSIMGRCRLVAITSLSEGGPSAIAEAIVTGVPVVATRVSGCVGMLGDDFPGLFAPGDTQALAKLLSRCEHDPTFYDMLRTACERRRPLFAPEAEKQAWRELLAEVATGGRDRPS
jgi:putative glycosyltransferase (TIGR04348 family)